MKKHILLFFSLFICCFLAAEENIIKIDNTKHRFEEQFYVTNQTTEAIFVEVFVKQKENTSEILVGTGVVLPQKLRYRIRTIADDKFDNYDYILVKTLGKISDYKMDSTFNDIIVHINSYLDSADNFLTNSKFKYENEIIVNNDRHGCRDYFKVENNTSNYLNCSFFGTLKDNGKEIFLGQKSIMPTCKHEIKTFAYGSLDSFDTFRITTDVKIYDYKSSISSHDCNLVINSCEAGKSPIEIESDYDNKDVDVQVIGRYEEIDSITYISSFKVKIKNETGKIIKLKFDESSITYNDKTSVPFIEGQKYIDAGNIPPTKIIPKGNSSDVLLFAANQISWVNDDWHIAPMSDDVTVILAIEIDSKTYYWIVTAKINN